MIKLTWGKPESVSIILGHLCVLIMLIFTLYYTAKQFLKEETSIILLGGRFLVDFIRIYLMKNILLMHKI